MKSFLLYLRTIRYLKFSQIFFRVKRQLITSHLSKRPYSKLIERPKYWVRNFPYSQKIFSNGKFRFLNQEKIFKKRVGWNEKNFSKLWNYNLHYFDDLVAENSHKRTNIHLELILDWISNNNNYKGEGWDPYPVSLRIVNIIKYWLNGNSLPTKVQKSIFTQTCYLEKNLEKHILGNHYFANLKAIFFSGIVFNEYDWIKFSEKEIIQQIHEQVLEDGSHFELSPMYHNIILYDLIDLYNLVQSTNLKNHINFKKILAEAIVKMVNFMNGVSHPDGKPSFFNDSTFDIAPSNSFIKEYLKKLNFHKEVLDISKIDYPSSGFYCSIIDNSKLIFSASEIKADYIPGHSHAGLQSFELSLNLQRFIVNSGINTYDISNDRLKQRSTLSYSTVQVDKKNSNEVWKSFRVGNRARVKNRYMTLLPKKNIFQSEHNGFSYFFNEIIHRRKIIHSKNSLEINDVLAGKFTNAVSRLFFHPKVTLKTKKDILIISDGIVKLRIFLKGLDYKIEDAYWYDGFNSHEKNKVLIINFMDKEISLKMSWS